MTTTCDHGIRLDRFCGDCESGFTFPEPVITHEQSRLVVLLCVLGLALMVLLAVGVRRG